jgi:uncharacterized protein (PEP-CTERM system associated)
MSPQRLPVPILLLGAVIMAAMAASIAFATDLAWDFNPRLSFSQIYSDNIRLDPPGEETSEFISQLNTGFNFDRQGGRASARVGYNLQSVFYWQATSSSALFHQFFADGNLVVLPERLSINAAAGYSQRQLTRERAGADNVNLGGDRGDVLTFRLNPVYTEQLDDFATFQTSYGYSRVEVLSQDGGGEDADNAGSNSQRNDLQVSLSSGPLFSRFGWGLSYSWSQTEFDDGASSSQQTAEALGRWNVSDRFSLFGVVGYELDEFEQEGGRTDPSGLTWRLGATYAASERTFMEAFLGSRSFGNTYGATLRHRMRNSQVSLDYSEDITTVNQFEIDQTIPRGVDATVEEALIVDGEPVLFDLESPELRSGAFVSRRLSLGYTGQRRKTNWGVRVFHQQRDFEVSGRSEQSQSITGNLGWRIRPRTSVVARAGVQQSDTGDQGEDQTLLTTSLGLSRQFTPTVSASVDYSFRDLDGTADTEGYQENRVSATIQKSF